MRKRLGSLIDAVASLVDHLERAKLPYAFGGAIAYSAWAEPRATRDIDLNLWAGASEMDRAFLVLEEAGVSLNREAATREIKERGMFFGMHGEYRVDVFVPSVPFYEEALNRRVRVRLAERETWVISPEALAVFKMLFYRPKDLADVGRLLEIQGKTFDRGFVRKWLVEMLGEDDERLPIWDQLASRT